MRKYLLLMLMILIMPIEFCLGVVWAILWLITLPFDRIWGRTIQRAMKKHLLGEIKDND